MTFAFPHKLAANGAIARLQAFDDFPHFLTKNIPETYTLETQKVPYLPYSNKRSAIKVFAIKMSLMTPFLSPSQSVHIKTSQSTMCSLVTTSRSGVGIDADWPNSRLFGSSLHK